MADDTENATMSADAADAGVISRTRAHHHGGGFRNPWPGSTPHGIGDFLRWRLTERRDTPRRPDPLPAAFPIVAPSFPSPRAAEDAIVVSWVGHSSFLLQIGGMNVLLDPVWSERASPVRFAGPRRHVAPGFAMEALPPVDLVLLSHDHYDHLDEPTVRRLIVEHPGARWIAPLGVGRWLARRGARVAAELDWWEHTTVDQLEITCTPAQHFSGRGLTSRDSTLWCGWVVRTGAEPGARAVFVAGDTAAHPEFGVIGRELGPFDAALLPIGAYDPRWFMRAVHMDPDDAVAAYTALRGAWPDHRMLFVGMHWGTFKLTDEPLDEPPRLTREAWARAGYPESDLWIPRHGETRVA